MSFDPHHSNPTKIRRFAAFSDQLEDGLAEHPEDECEETLVHTITTLGPVLRASTVLPSIDRQEIWGKIMQNTAIPAPRFTTASSSSAWLGSKRFASPARKHRLSQWHAAGSFVAVLVFLAGIVGIAYFQGPHQNPKTAGNSLAGQILYDSDDASTFIQAPADCVANGGTFTPDDELTSKASSDWPEPAYAPVKAVQPEVGEQILQTYLGFVRCTYDATKALNWMPGTPVTYQDIVPLTAMTYLSDRYRFGAFIYNDLSAEQQVSVDTFYCHSRTSAILEAFPLPVNAANDSAVLERTVDNLVREAVGVFNPFDVYLLPDGRYGAIIGTISSEDLVRWLSGGDAANAEPSSLLFVAFVERDGSYYVDEEIVLSSVEGDRPLHRSYQDQESC